MRFVTKSIVFILFLMIDTQIVQSETKISVFVSIVPQHYVVQQISKDLVDIQVMVAPGANPHTYEPKPQQMIAISKAQLYFSIGVSFENVWLSKLVSFNPNLLVIHTDAGITKLPMDSHDHDHHHADKNEHHEEIVDPHIWLSPPLVKIQARHILIALQDIDPANRLIYEANYTTFISKLEELDHHIRQLLTDKQGLEFMVFHPSWGYFAHTYGLKQVPIEIEGKSPKPEQMKQLIDYARKHNITAIFQQPQISSKSAEQIAREINGKVVFVDPLALDWSENLLGVARQLGSRK
ncbi:MAG: zinc ABC transporter substrate-binding protein [Desulfobacterales bacterium]|nr:zinc ABC transporter substrate-binding protein [Desulfobacterales bacterium]